MGADSKSMSFSEPPPSKCSAQTLKVLTWAALWYFFSGCTLFLNKYILSGLKVNPNALGAYQMCITCVLGGIKVYGARMTQVARDCPHPKKGHEDDEEGEP